MIFKDIVRFFRHDGKNQPLYLCHVNLDSEHIRIRQAREQAGFSQIEMAEELGVGRTTYISFETGRTKLYNKLVTKMADRLGFEPEELLYGQRPDEALLRDQASIDDWKRNLVNDYEQRIAILQDKLDAANKIISYKDANIQTLTQSNQYLLEQLRKND